MTSVTKLIQIIFFITISVHSSLSEFVHGKYYNLINVGNNLLYHLRHKGQWRLVPGKCQFPYEN
ncbi:unnamed protein product, partial [Allacma fusca]